MGNLTVCRSVFGLVAAALTAPVFAQQEDTTFIEEIVVTSSKRESTLQEIPIAVSVVQADDIRQSQVMDVKDLQFSAKLQAAVSSGGTAPYSRMRAPGGIRSRTRARSAANRCRCCSR